MHFCCTGIADHLNDFLGSGPAHNRIVHKYYPLAFEHPAIGIVFEFYTHVPDRIRWLNKGPAHIVIADNAKLEWQTGFL